MPIKDFDKFGHLDLWGLFDEDTEDTEYFLTEKSAKKYVKKHKIKRYILMQENG